jgi:hypothetical protein
MARIKGPKKIHRYSAEFKLKAVYEDYEYPASTIRRVAYEYHIRVPGTTISPFGRRKQTIISFVTPGDRPARAGLVGEPQMRGLAVEPPSELVDVRLPAPDRSHEHRWIDAGGLDVRDADKLFVVVQTDEKGSRLGHG